MGHVNIKPSLSNEEVERLAIDCILKAAEDGLLNFNTVRQLEYDEQMRKYQESAPVEAGKFTTPKKGFQLKFAMSQDEYHWHRLVAPDGMKNFDQNLNYMKFLKDNYPRHKNFPLIDKPWEDIAG